MNFLFNLLVFFVFLFFQTEIYSLNISPKEIKIIGEKIGENECGKKIINLTHWNKGEAFGSFGIGHFIWYPEGKKENFHETFPDLLIFLKTQGIKLPPWLAEAKGSPWKTRDEFYAAIESDNMVALRQLLYETKDLQAIFIVNHIEKSINEIMNQLPKNEKEPLHRLFSQLASTSQGIYVMIDYANFKGLGTTQKESYKGMGWGLLQVLRSIPANSSEVIQDFALAAKQVLILRVKNSPEERHEEKWLKGWLNRIDTYTQVDAKIGFSKP